MSEENGTSEKTFWCKGHETFLPASAFEKPSKLVKYCRECKAAAYERKKQNNRERAQRLKSTPASEGKVRCTHCFREFDKSDFITDKGKETKYCSTCRQVRCEIEKKRVYTPEDKQRRREQNRIARRWVTYRARRRAADLEGYRAECAARAREWRQNNPEHYAEYRRKNLRHHSNGILGQARRKNIPVSVTIEYLESVMKEPCFYCGFLDDKGFGGADRVNNNRGYHADNLVPCCMFCNMAKAALDPVTFFECAAHITHAQTSGAKHQPYPDAWETRYNTVSMHMYRDRAKNKGLAFDMTDEHADETLCDTCVHCKHNRANGWDRVDHAQGYVPENVVSSCTGCNYLRRALSIPDFYALCERVADHMTQTDALERARAFDVPRNRYHLNKRVIDPEDEPDPEEIDSDDDLDVAADAGLFDPEDEAGPSEVSL